MKRILVILLSLVMCMGLMVTAFGCGVADAPEIIKDNPDEGGPVTDPDLGNDKIQNFNSAWEAFTYAKDRFENIEKDFVSYMSGTSTSSALSGLVKSSQAVYNERYKSSKTNNFYFNTNCYGEIIFNNDPCMAFKVYKLNNSASYQAHIEHGNFTSNSHGSRVESKKIVADFTGVDYGNPLDSDEMISTYGSNPVKLSVYVIDENTVENKNESELQKLPDGSYKFTFKFNKGVHKNYRTQVKAFSQKDYGEWRDTSITFTVDKFGRIKKIESIDKYTIAFTGNPEVTAKTEEDFYYGYTSDIQMINGNIVATLERLKTT